MTEATTDEPAARTSAHRARRRHRDVFIDRPKALNALSPAVLRCSPRRSSLAAAGRPCAACCWSARAGGRSSPVPTSASWRASRPRRRRRCAARPPARRRHRGAPRARHRLRRRLRARRRPRARARLRLHLRDRCLGLRPARGEARSHPRLRRHGSSAPSGRPRAREGAHLHRTAHRHRRGRRDRTRRPPVPRPRVAARRGPRDARPVATNAAPAVGIAKRVLVSATGSRPRPPARSRSRVSATPSAPKTCARGSPRSSGSASPLQRPLTPDGGRGGPSGRPPRPPSAPNVLDQPIRAESQANPSKRTPSAPNISRCRCGPVDWPVVPTRPSCCPAMTR